MTTPRNVTSAADVRGIDSNFIIIHICRTIRPCVVLSNTNQPAWCRRCHIQTDWQSGGCRSDKRSRANAIFSNLPTNRTATVTVSWTAAFALKQHTEDGWKVSAALPGAGVLRKTVRSAKPARLNININMLAQAVALADSIKFLLCLSDKHQIWQQLSPRRLKSLTHCVTLHSNAR